jgi:putative oxygen-independent coproporphyrinogen III oxidase
VAGVYLSYPFCAQKCSYCNFASGVFSRETEARYRAVLRREIQRHQWAWGPETVYLGGGTPSAMEAGALQELLALIPGRPWREATLEAAPGSLTPEKARAWQAAGIDRVSLGVQSFVSRELARTGRRHTAQTVTSDMQVLRQCGIDNINIDLIAGLPGQSPATWRESLEWIARLAPPHVSVYMLEVDQDSRLGREILAGGSRYGAGERASDELTADLYEMAVERLAKLGLQRYEISNFAWPGRESRHNLKYWKLEPYVGFGADAHSFDGRWRWQNPESIEEYLGGVRGECIEARPWEERFYVGLRLSQGIRPDPREWQRFEAPIGRFLELGLLERENGTLRLTPRGVLLSNEVFLEFLT